MMSDKIAGHRRYESLHVLKLCCALVVVMIHCPSAFKGVWLVAFGHLVLPLFFMISGFFLSDDGVHVDVYAMRRRFVRVLWFTIGAQSLYFVWRVLLCLCRGDDLAWVTDVRFWAATVLFGGNLNVALWYLNAYLQSLLVIWILAKYDKIGWLYGLLPFGIVLCILTGELCVLWNGEIAWIYSRNVLTLGLPCMTLGLLVKRREHRLPSVKGLLVAGLVFLLLFFVEAWINIGSGNYVNGGVMLFAFPLALVVFTLFVKRADARMPRALVACGGRYSGNIYVGHTLVGDALAMSGVSWFGVIGSFVVFGVTAVMSWAYQRAKSFKFK